MSKPHPLFPIELNTNWKKSTCFQLDKNLMNWLLDADSLTARLKKQCKVFDVKVLGQRVEPCRLSESNDTIIAGEPVLVREVLLYCDGIAQVFARSLLPLSSLTGEEQQLAHIGNQPLGQVLFSNPSLERKNIEISSFPIEESFKALLQHLNFSYKDTLWGRRSLFFLHDKPLMVAEVFLPPAVAYQQMVNK